MNNSLGNFDEYWHLFRQHRILQGEILESQLAAQFAMENNGGTDF